MTAIRIHPGAVRTCGLTAIACSDDLRTQATLLQGMALPDMPAAMAARHESALNSIGIRLGALATDFSGVGEELQVRAAAAEAADAASDGSSIRAGQALSTSLVTATIVSTGGAMSTVTLAVNRSRVVASTSAGLRLTIPDALERPPLTAGASANGPASPHDTPRERPAANRTVEANRPVGGAPAAAVHQAATALPSTSPDLGAASILQGDAIDPADMPGGEHRAEHVDTGATEAGTPAPADMPSHGETDRQDWACWMASTAARHGLPPALPVMMALARSGMQNMPGGESEVGFFGLDPSATYAPAGFGVGRDTQPSGDWWASHPDAQLDHIVSRLDTAAGGIRNPGLDDPEALGRWASEAAPQLDTTQFADAQAAADEMVSHCRQEHAATTPHTGGALGVARGQLGVHEFGANAGPKVNEFLASADVASGNPWCASFVNWSLQESGREMPGTGWAAVSTWVNAAESGQHGLQIVDASSARPGDIVAYDWGGQSDFGSDGHIGFLESTVDNGHFTTVEGNAQDAVTRMDRNIGSGNVVFIRTAA